LRGILSAVIAFETIEIFPADPRLAAPRKRRYQ
jgi:hypothetical protein